MSISSPRAKRNPGNSIAGVPPERLRARSIRGAPGGKRTLLYVYVNVNHASRLPRPGGRPAAPCADEDLARLALERADLGEHLLDLFALALELLAAGGERGDELLQLRPLVRRRIVELQHLVYLGEGEAEPLPAQDQLQAHPVALGIDAPRSVAAGAEQAFVLVEADGAMGHVELAREVGDAVGFGGLVHRRNAERVLRFVAGGAIICENSHLSPREAFGFYSDLLAPSKARDPRIDPGVSARRAAGARRD